MAEWVSLSITQPPLQEFALLPPPCASLGFNLLAALFGATAVILQLPVCIPPLPYRLAAYASSFRVAGNPLFTMFSTLVLNPQHFGYFLAVVSAFAQDTLVIVQNPSCAFTRYINPFFFNLHAIFRNTVSEQSSVCTFATSPSFNLLTISVSDGACFNLLIFAIFVVCFAYQQCKDKQV